MYGIEINPQAPVVQKIANEVVFRRFKGEGVEFFKIGHHWPSLRILMRTFWKYLFFLPNKRRVSAEPQFSAQRAPERANRSDARGLTLYTVNTIHRSFSTKSYIFNKWFRRFQCFLRPFKNSKIKSLLRPAILIIDLVLKIGFLLYFDTWTFSAGPIKSQGQVRLSWQFRNSKFRSLVIIKVTRLC